MTTENKATLFQEGLTSYMDAMLALREFRREVHKKSEAVLTGRLHDLGQALGTQLGSDAIQPYVGPANPSSFAGEYAWITSRLINVPGLAADSAHFGLLWNGIDETPQVAAGFWFNTAPGRDKARAIFGTSGEELSQDTTGWYFSEELSAGKASDFEKVLDRLINKWISLWTQVGGLKAVASVPVGKRK